MLRRLKNSPGHRGPIWAACLVALVSTLAAAALRLALMPWLGNDSPLMLLVVPVLVSAWYGGFLAGAFATALGIVAGEFLFLAPQFSIYVFDPVDQINLVLFLLVGLTISALTERMHRANHQLMDQRTRLEREVRERIAAERALQAGEERLRFALESGGMGIWSLDLERNIINFDLDGAVLVGLAPEKNEHPLEDFMERVHPDDVQRVRQKMILAASGVPENEEYRVAMPDGSYVWRCSYGQVTKSADGSVRLIGVTLDIDARKRGAAELFESREQFRLATEALDGLVYDWNPESDFVWRSEGILNLLGYELQETELTSEWWRNHIHPDDLKTYTECFDEAVSSRQDVISSEYRVWHRDDRWLWVWDNARLIYDDGGKLRRIVGCTVPIDARKRAEEAARTYETRYRLATSAGRVGIWDWDIRTNSVTWSESLYPMHGLQPGEFGGDVESFSKLIHPDDRERVQQAITNAVECGASYEIEFRILRPDGRIVWIFTNAKITCDDDGRAIRMSGATVDITERKRAEEALRESEQRHRQLADAMPQLVWTADPDGRVDYYNSRISNLAGALRNGDGTWQWEPVVHPHDLEKTRLAWSEALKSGSRYQVEHRIRMVDGSYRWLLSRAIPARDDSGKIVKWYGTATDIQDLREAETALRESEGRLRLATETAQLGVFEYYPAEDRSVWVNNRMYEIFNRSRDQGPFNREEFMSDYIYPEDAETYTRDLTEAAEKDELVRTQCRVRLNDGEIRWIEITGRFDRETEEAPLRLVGLIADITDRKRAEEALRESEEWFRTLADNIAQFAWMADSNGWIFWYNRRWFEYSGTTMEEMQGWGWKKVHHPEHVERVVENFRNKIEAGEDWEDTFPLRGRDGNYRWFLSRAMPIRDSAGNVVRWFGTNTDITKQREAEQALVEADRRKDEFLAVLAHELRNPLAPIHNALQLMRSPGDDPLRAQRLRDVIDQQVRQMTRLIDDLLDVSRISRGKIALKRERVDLNDLIYAAIEASRFAIDEAGHEITVSGASESLVVHADQTRMTQVLSNLLSNAAKYTPRSGRIRVTGERDGNEAVIRIRDNGIGIPPDKLDYIFDMFAQVDTSLEREHGGLGIGLTLVKTLVGMHGGAVEAHSDGPGQGSEFILRLPLVDAGTGLASPSAGAPRSDLDVFQVLVVEDHAVVGELFAEVLREMGHEVRLVTSAAIALKEVETFRPDVIFSDISMPGMDGYQLAQRLRRLPQLEGVYLVAMTGFGQEEDRERALEAGFDRHLVKPAEEEDLREVFQSLAIRRGLRPA